MKSGGFHTDFTLKSGGFHPEIRRISWNPWNPADFRWNPADFTQISPVKSKNYKRKCFSKNSSVWWMQGGGYDQGFHEIHQISPWNLVDLTCEIWWISPRFHLWNPPKIIKASVSAKTLQFDECRVGLWPRISWNPPDFTLKSGRFDLWNPVDFTQIPPVKSTQNYKSKCFSKNSSVWWMQGGGFHPWNLVDFTLKSGGFHPWNLADFTQISPVKSTQTYKSKCFSKNSSVWWMQGGGYDQGFHPWNLQISPRFHLWNPPKL